MPYHVHFYAVIWLFFMYRRYFLLIRNRQKSLFNVFNFIVGIVGSGYRNYIKSNFGIDIIVANISVCCCHKQFYLVPIYGLLRLYIGIVFSCLYFYERQNSLFEGYQINVFVSRTPTSFQNRVSLLFKIISCDTFAPLS